MIKDPQVWYLSYFTLCIIFFTLMFYCTNTQLLHTEGWRKNKKPTHPLYFTVITNGQRKKLRNKGIDRTKFYRNNTNDGIMHIYIIPMRKIRITEKSTGPIHTKISK